MRKQTWRTIALSVLFGLLLALAGTKDASAGMSFGISIGVPPAFVFHSFPSIEAIPGTSVYFVPGIGARILFYEGCWYYPRAGIWYRAVSRRGPWVRLGHRNVPHALMKLPPQYRKAPREHRRIPYAHKERNLRKWDRERWNGREAWRQQQKGRAEHGRGRDGYERWKRK